MTSSRDRHFGSRLLVTLPSGQVCGGWWSSLRLWTGFLEAVKSSYVKPSAYNLQETSRQATTGETSIDLNILWIFPILAPLGPMFFFKCQSFDKSAKRALR